MSNTKMVVVIRRDLNMVPGLLASQVAHTAMEFIRKRPSKPANIRDAGIPPKAVSKHFSHIEDDWIQAPYIAVLAVDTPEELHEIEKAAKADGLQTHQWIDVIPSQVLQGRAFQNWVGLSIGPADADALKKVTGTLPLY